MRDDELVGPTELGNHFNVKNTYPRMAIYDNHMTTTHRHVTNIIQGQIEDAAPAKQAYHYLQAINLNPKEVNRKPTGFVETVLGWGGLAR